jgi:hypothetical protein
VAGQVQEQTAAGLLGLHAPGQMGGVEPQLTVTGVARVDAANLAQAPAIDDLLRLHEALESAPVVSDEQRQLGPLEGFDHARALGVSAAHRLLYIGGFAGGCDFER